MKYGAWVMDKPNRLVVDSVPILKKDKCKTILDLGCGNGRHIKYLAKKYFFVVGADIAEDVLKTARKNVKKAALLKSDMEKMPFLDGSFDAVISISTIEHARIEKIRKTLKEIKRILRHNGILIVLTEPEDGSANRGGKIIAPHTYSDKGKLHYIFDKKRLTKTFSLFKILEAKKVLYKWFDTDRIYWKLICKKV